jgi:SAM-dependent methyltransferase
MTNGDRVLCLHPDYVCPDCHAGLADTTCALRCKECSSLYPVDDGIADFSHGQYYDNFVPAQALTNEHAAALDEEITGAVSRIQDSYLPLLQRHFRRKTVSGRVTRVLDCGCGNGLSVDLLSEAGFVAFGNDPSALRKWQWRQRQRRERLAVAGGSKLPFPDGHFDAVISSGVFEHIGVREAADPYRVESLPDCHDQRRIFLQELLRVLAPGGRIWVDFPNGAFPIDFWHDLDAGNALAQSPRRVPADFEGSARIRRGYRPGSPRETGRPTQTPAPATDSETLVRETLEPSDARSLAGAESAGHDPAGRNTPQPVPGDRDLPRSVTMRSGSTA